MAPRKFTYPFCYTPAPEIVEESRKLIATIEASAELSGVFAEGKMMGILEVEDREGKISFLHGFSGLAGGRACIEGFVPPIFDWTLPEGHFRRTEALISEIGEKLAESTDTEEADALRRRRRDMSVELQEWLFDNYMVSNALGETLSISEVFARKGLVPPGGTGDCAAPKLLQYAYLHDLRPVAMGEFWFGGTPAHEIRRQGSFYPSCTGKCGPLLDFMLQGLDVEDNPLEKDGGWTVTMDAKDEHVKASDMMRSRSCDLIVRPEKTARILFVDEWIVVAVKPSGLLSVPGRYGQESLQHLLEGHFGRSVLPCHRLDMDTAGLMVFAFDEKTQALMHRMFAEHRVAKTYLALLAPEGARNGVELTETVRGRISLPIAPDWYDRPRQCVDKREGKSAVTEYEVLSVGDDGRVLVRLSPHTGRTHQLRVHAAHPEGLGRPIVGDRLYGGADEGSLLQLLADSLEFEHPSNGVLMKFGI